MKLVQAIEQQPTLTPHDEATPVDVIETSGGARGGHG